MNCKTKEFSPVILSGARKAYAGEGPLPAPKSHAQTKTPLPHLHFFALLLATRLEPTTRPVFLEVYLENNRLFDHPIAEGEEKPDGVLLYND